jgi:hypothetical protein
MRFRAVPRTSVRAYVSTTIAQRGGRRDEMRKRTLGRSGLEVSTVGAMTNVLILGAAGQIARVATRAKAP